MTAHLNLGSTVRIFLLTLMRLCIRRQVLLEQSRNWIRAEDLDARIEEALDNPIPLMKQF